MIQLAPALAGMECFLKVLKVMQAMSNISIDTLPEIAKAVGEMVACFNVFAKLPCMIVDILKMIIAYLKCIIQAVESVLKFQVGIDFSGASGNPVLLASLNCAQNNANASTAQLKEALAVVEPLLAVVKPIGDMAPSLPGPVGDALEILPQALAAITQVLDSGGASAGVPGSEEMIAKLDEVKDVLKQVEEALALVPC
jgi:hypothetical protein